MENGYLKSTPARLATCDLGLTILGSALAHAEGGREAAIDSGFYELLEDVRDGKWNPELILKIKDGLVTYLIQHLGADPAFYQVLNHAAESIENACFYSMWGMRCNRETFHAVI